MPLRALVVGGSGQIGGWLLWTLADRGHEAVGTYATVAYPGLVHLDAADLAASAALVRARKPDVVFYPAGFTWVDGCERDPARARSANLEQPLNVARASADSGARFVYFSTDYVFDGMAGPYTEDGPVNPLSAYGRSKYEAELALAEALGEANLTVRTTWVYGPERQGKNFSYQLAKALSAGKSLECPTDQVSNPTYGPDVARAVVGLVEAGQGGLIHVAGPEVMDRVRFARELARGFGLDPAPIIGKATAELGQGAPRPLDGGLLSRRLESLLPGAMRPVAECMADYLSRLETTEGLAHPLPLPPVDLVLDATPLEPRIL